MLEQIAKQVNLKKRVVQVWYQNSRARERKGQYRTSSNIMSSASGNMIMESFVGTATGVAAAATHSGNDCASVLDTLKSPKLDANSSVSTSDLGFLFNSFKQHY